MASTAYSAATINIPPSPGYKVNTLFGWNATNNTTVPFTVTRALDTATRVDENGLIVPVLANVPRIDYAEGTDCGSLLIEPERTNRFTESVVLSTANGWNQNNTSVTLSTGISPDGALTATKVIPNNLTIFSDSNPSISKSFNKSSAVVATYTTSIFAKADEYNLVKFWIIGSGGSNRVQAVFNVETGTVVSTAISGSFSNPIGSIVSYPNGWYRCILTYTTDANLSVGTLFIVGDTIATQGDGTSGLLMWGAQSEEGSYATSYIPTSGGTATRNADVISLTGVSELIGQSEGSLMINLKSLSTDTYYISLSDTVNNRAFIKSDNFELFVAGVKQCDVTQAVDFGVYSKTLISYAPADYKIAVDGNVNTTVGIDNQLTFPPNTLTTVSFNNLNISGGFPFYGRIKSLLIYKTALDSDLSEVLSGYATYNELAINKNYTVL